MFRLYVGLPLFVFVPGVRGWKSLTLNMVQHYHGG